MNYTNNYTNHYILEAKNRGYNQDLSGKTAFVYILVSDPVSHWKNQSEVDSCIKKIKEVSAWLMKEAARRRIPLQIRDFVMKASSQTVVNYETPYGWHTNVVRSIKRSSLMALQNEIKKSGNFKEVAVVFLFNRTERSFAHPVTTNLNEDEFAAAYAADSFLSIAHEILHLFGAADLYYPERIRNAAQRHFGNGIMISGTENDRIDDLTLYLIGWHKTPSHRAALFLNEISSVSRAERDAALNIQLKDGVSRITFSNGTIYEGPVKHGVPDGYGTFIYKNGDRYTGEIRASQPHGRGKIVYAKGGFYDGEWKDSKMCGHGICSYKNGDYYVGEFEANAFSGYGEYHYASGKVQKGFWKNHRLI